MTLAGMCLIVACGKSPSPPSAAAPATGASARPSAPGPMAETRTPKSREPVLLADGSFLAFRSSVDRRLDGVPLQNIETLRVLVNYTRTNFFVNENEPRGFEYEYLRDFERFLNQRLRRTDDPIRFEFVITDLDRILSDLTEGRGDIAAASLTITPLRDQKVDFSLPYLTNVDELVVTHRNVPPPASLDALGGKRFLVPGGSSYAEHLKGLARAQREAGKTPVEVIEAEPGLGSGST